MADVPGLIAGLAICPDVVTPAADKQMLHRAIANLVGTPRLNAVREITHYGLHSMKWTYEVFLVI